MSFKPYTRSALAFLAASMLLSSKCNKDPLPPPPPDPCAAITPFKADFVMLEEIGDTAFAIADSAIINRFVTFKAVGEYDSIKWEVGTRLNSSTKTAFSLYFNVLENRIPVKFTGYNARGSNCFPGTPTVQTITKHLTIVPETSTALLGSYFGYNTDNPKDTFTVLLQRSPYFLFVKNLPIGCNGYKSPNEGGRPLNFGIEAAQGFSGFMFDQGAWLCGKVEARGYLVNRDTLVVNYKHWPKANLDSFDYRHDTIPLFKKFIGVRKR
jgi:hypothetical protein